MPKLTIIIPTYNSASTIDRCLRSIAAQTFTDYEVIVQDGSAKDATARKIEKFLKSHGNVVIRLFRERDRGVYDAMNRAMSRAFGEWLYFLGSDDELHDERVLEAMMNPQHVEGCDVLYGNVRVIGDCKWAADGALYDGPFDLDKLLKKNICHQAMFYRAELARKIGTFNVDYRVCADWDFNLRCWATAKFKYVDRTIAKFYAGGVSAGDKRDERFNHDVAANVIRYFNLSPFDPLINSHDFPGHAEILKMQRLNGVADLKQGSSALVKAIAFYLPQFHPIPENDGWWGQGFTEWTNVAKAKPLFEGHYQPHLPADLGFYDLRLAEAREAQAKLAREYGIHGFCYYHYWFNGRRLLERPVDEMLATGRPDFPFCLCWANENWTRRWDGEENQILLEQVYSESDDAAHIRYLLPFFKDPRYIRVAGKPVFLVYRANRIPNPSRTAAVWRQEAEKAGLPGLFLIRMESIPEETGDPREMGFDAALEFQPNWQLLFGKQLFRQRWWHRKRLGTAEPAFVLHGVFGYDRLVDAAIAMKLPSYPFIRGVCVGFDNSPRRQSGGLILKDATPDSYGRWLSHVCDAISRESQHSSTRGLVFINAWNEWGEGNHLEPCRKWGRAYLEATRDVLLAWAKQVAGNSSDSDFTKITGAREIM